MILTKEERIKVLNEVKDSLYENIELDAPKGYSKNDEIRYEELHKAYCAALYKIHFEYTL